MVVGGTQQEGNEGSEGNMNQKATLGQLDLEEEKKKRALRMKTRKGCCFLSPVGCSPFSRKLIDLS